MGRRPRGTKSAAVSVSSSDGASENGTASLSALSAVQSEVGSNSTSSGYDSAVAGGRLSTPVEVNTKRKTSEDDKTALLGLLNYSSDSDDEGWSAAPGPVTGGSGTSDGITGIVAVEGIEEKPGSHTFDASSGRSEGHLDADTRRELILPAGWQECKDSMGAVYYWNTATDETTWDLPRGARYRDSSSKSLAKAAAASSSPAASEQKAPVDKRGNARGQKDTEPVSDATSDTASEPEDGGSEIENNAETSSAAQRKTSGPERSLERRGGLDGARKERRAPAEGGTSATAQRQSSSAPPPVDGGVNSEAPHGRDDNATGEEKVASATAAAGVDDLLADIEAELLSGTGSGTDGVQEPSRLPEQAICREDFSELEAIATGLGERARKAHDDFSGWLAKAEEEKAENHGPDSAARRKLAVELGAVLRARLSDWKEGGLDGTFLVQKLEDMAVQARACVASLDTASMDVGQQAGDNAEPSESEMEEINAAPPSSKPTATASKDTAKGRSKRKHRLPGGAIALLAPTAEATSAAEPEKPADERDSVDPGSRSRDEDPHQAAERTIEEKHTLPDAAAAAEKLKWADQVSAAASAAVAAAIRAKKLRAKHGREQEGNEGRGSEEPQVAVAGGDKAVMKGVSDVDSKTETEAAEDGTEEEVVPRRGGGTDDGKGGDGKGATRRSLSNTAAGGTVTRTPTEGADDDRAEGEPELPGDWAAVWDKKHGAYYYHNVVTDETSWTLPERTAAASSASTATAVAATGVKTNGSRPSSEGEASSKTHKPAPSTGGSADDQSDVQEPRKSSEGRTSDCERSPERAESISAKKAPENAKSAPYAVLPVDKPGEAASNSEEVVAPHETAVKEALAKPSVSSTADDLSQALPRPWAAVWDDNHKAFYYHNTATDEVSWQSPAPPAAVSSAAEKISDEGAAKPLTSIAPKEKDDIAVDKGATTTSSGSVEASEGSPSSTSATDATCNTSPTVSAASAISAPATKPAPAQVSAVDMRPFTLVWWSDAGDVWTGESLSGLLMGYGPRRYRNLGGGYYMITLEMGAEWAAAAVVALSQGVDNPVEAARLHWVCCTASTPGYGLFLRWAGDDDEQKLFEVPDQFFDDPPPDPAAAVAEQAAAAQAAALAEAEAAAENAEANAAAAAAIAATEQAEAAGSEAAAAAAIAASAASASTKVGVAARPAAGKSSTSKKRKTSSKTSSKGSSVGSISKKRKGAASLIDKWKTVASTAGEESEREAEKQQKMERWKARAAALDPDNPNFIPVGRKRR